MTKEYTVYRTCLRWEFGFTCALCYLHEQDLLEVPIDGSGLITIEHHQLKGHDEAKRKDYANCLLACRWCNTARSTYPERSASGEELLDPTDATWSARFAYDDELVLGPTKTGDADAEYTRKVYRLDAPFKAELRRNRRRRVMVFLRARAEVPVMLELLAEAKVVDDEGLRTRLVRAAKAIEANYENAKAEMMRYEAPPREAPGRCACGGEREIPAWLSGQLFSL